MASNPQRTTATAPAAPEPTEKQKRLIEFVPFGAKDKIQLSIELVKRIVAAKTKSGKSCTDEDAFKFMLLCQARKLNPFEGDAFLVGYDTNDGPKFSLITAHQAFLKRAEASPEFDGMQSGTIVMRGGDLLDLVGDWHMPNDTVLGGWATVYFKTRKHPMTKRLRVARFNKGFGVWRDDPAGMIVKCAEADALRSSFPTMLGGMYTHEESTDVLTAETIAHAAFPTELPPPEDKRAELTAGTTTTAAPAAEKAPVPTAAPAPPAGTTATGGKKEQPPKKAQAPAAATTPSLSRKSSAAGATTSSQSTSPTAQAASSAGKTSPSEPPSDKDKLKTMLAVGGCTPEDFVAAALQEGWIDPEIGAWDKIPEARFTEFVRPENWTLVAEVLDERRTQAATPTATRTPKAGELL